MNLQTKILLSKLQNNQIDYSSRVVLFGSCFSENIGEKLDYFKFQNTQNPFGILFNPKAIETLIKNALQDKVFNNNDVFFHNERWHCFDAHSILSSVSKENLLSVLNLKTKETKEALKRASHIIITLGTAWVYRYLDSNTIVTNCHKVAQNKFEKELLTVKAIETSLENIITLIQSINSEAIIIFTVSPVRHLKDGFVENTESKSHLISAIHQVIRSSIDRVLYFPSYEIMMDELRDYRFYAEDMIHPNQTAIHYIWERFKSIWISEDSYKVMEAVAVVQKGLQHKPFNKDSEAHQKFLQKLKEKQSQIISEFPHISF